MTKNCCMTFILMCIAIFAFPITSSFAQDVSFSSAGTFQVGDQAGNNNVATTGDFNTDGALDLAVVNGDSRDVSILLGQSNGSFQNEIRVTLGSGLVCPGSPAVGDFNRDGKQDLAVGSCAIGNSNITVLIGNGDGTFGPPTNFPVGSQAFSVAVGDFNRNGIADLVAANYGSGDVSILLGRGNGHFESQIRYDVGSGPASIAMGDLNRDGIPDLITANSGSSDVSVLLGLGDGTFGPEIRSSVGTSVFDLNPISVAVRDLNLDGIEDVAVANFLTNDTTILLGFGDGSFFPPERYYTSSSLPACPTSVSIDDFNRDGYPDLAFTNVCRAESSVLLGLGDGTFLAATRFDVGTAPRSVVVGDFNRDGEKDLATINSGDNNISVLLNTTDYIPSEIRVIDFRPARSLSSGQGTTAVVVADFNRDGKTDLATANRNDDNISVFSGNGAGYFGSPLFLSVGDEPRELAVGDVDRNGTPDIIVANYGSGTISILPSDGTGSFNPTLTRAVGDDPISLDVGDVDNNGKPDIVVAHYFEREIITLLGYGNGYFYIPSDLLPNFEIIYLMKSVALGDLNRDGILDLATALEALQDEDAINVQLGNGEGSFGIGLAGDIVAGSSPFPLGGNWHRPEDVAIGDLNRDGIPDLVAAAGGGISLITLMGQGDTALGPLFGSPDEMASGNNPFSVVIADLNRDGIPDLASTNFNDNTVSIFTGDGTGAFQPYRTFTVGDGPTSLAVGDFNRDGRPDLATANQRDGTLSILLNRFPDQDNDGIADDVDTDPLTFSNDFSDIDLGGTTTGTITSRGDQTLNIVEAQNPDGVRITSDPSGGPVAATVSPCTGALSLSLDGGDEVVVTCGSVTIRIIEGSVGVQFAAPYAPATLAVDAGSAMTFDPTTGTLEAPASNAQPLVVVVNGGDLVVAPGDSVQLPVSEPPMQNILRRGWSLHAGRAEPFGTLGNSTDPGPTVNLDYVYPITDRLAADLRLGHSRFSGSGGANDVDISNLSANLKFVPQATMPWVFFNGGLGLYYVDSRDLEGGYNLGIGVGWRVTPDLDVVLTANYHSTFTASPDLEFGKYQLGLIWAF